LPWSISGWAERRCGGDAIQRARYRHRKSRRKCRRRFSPLYPGRQFDHAALWRDGLGLSICRKLVFLMEGKLQVEKRAAGREHLQLHRRMPIAAVAESPAPAAECRLPRSQRPLRILVAEDNPINSKVALRLLERMGHRVDAAWDGQQAVAAVEQIEYDLVLMDLPDAEHGRYEATRAIRRLARRAAAPIVAMTANAMADDRRRCLEAGMDGFLAKPVSTRISTICWKGCALRGRMAGSARAVIPPARSRLAEYQARAGRVAPPRRWRQPSRWRS